MTCTLRSALMINLVFKNRIVTELPESTLWRKFLPPIYLVTSFKALPVTQSISVIFLYLTAQLIGSVGQSVWFIVFSLPPPVIHAVHGALAASGRTSQKSFSCVQFLLYEVVSLEDFSRRYMAEILPLWRKTLFNQSINSRL